MKTVSLIKALLACGLLKTRLAGLQTQVTRPAFPPGLNTPFPRRKSHWLIVSLLRNDKGDTQRRPETTREALSSKPKNGDASFRCHELCSSLPGCKRRSQGGKTGCPGGWAWDPGRGGGSRSERRESPRPGLVSRKRRLGALGRPRGPKAWRSPGLGTHQRTDDPSNACSRPTRATRGAAVSQF